MKPKASKITPLQFMFTVACYVQSSALLTTFFVPIITYEAWISVVAGLLVFTPTILIYLALSRLFPGKSIIEIFHIVLGRIGGFVFSLLVIFFFATLTSLNLRDLGLLAKATIMSDTPPVVMTSLCILVCAYGVYHGLHAVVRYSVAFTLLSVVVVIAVSLITLSLWNFDYFLPLFQQPTIRYIQSGHISATIPNAELLIFMMIIPHVKRAKKGLGWYFFGGFLIGVLVLLTVVVRDTAVLGNAVSLFSMPPFETQRMVSAMQGLSRLEILYIIVMIVLWFFKVLVLYYATANAVAQLCGLKSYHPLVLVLGAVFVSYSIFAFPNIPVHMAFGREDTATLWTFFSVVLPLITLIIAKLRRIPAKVAASAQAID